MWLDGATPLEDIPWRHNRKCHTTATASDQTNVTHSQYLRAAARSSHGPLSSHEDGQSLHRDLGKQEARVSAFEEAKTALVDKFAVELSEEWEFDGADALEMEEDHDFTLLSGMIRCGPSGSSGRYRAIPTEDDMDPAGAAHESNYSMWQAAVKSALEDPSNSPAGCAFEYFMIVCIICSVFTPIMETVPELGDSVIFMISETSFTTFVSIEICLRFWTCDSSRQYFTDVFNIIDIVSTIPGYSELLLPFLKQHKEREQVEDVSGSMQTLRLAQLAKLAKTIRLLRVLRLAKVMRQSEPMVVVVKSIWGSLQGLGVLVAFVMLGTVLAATVCFFFEVQTESTQFTSIPASIWWSASTILAVGYGDIVPESVPGKITAMVTMLAGTVIMAVCIAVITSSFTEHYQRNLYMARAKNLQSRIKAVQHLQASRAASSSDLPADASNTASQQVDDEHEDSVSQQLPVVGNRTSGAEAQIHDDGGLNIAECVSQLDDMTTQLLMRLEFLNSCTSEPHGAGAAVPASELRYARMNLDNLRKSSRLWFEQVRSFSEELLSMNARMLEKPRVCSALKGRRSGSRVFNTIS